MVDGIGDGSLVILHCGSPKEKMWGVVVRLDAVGLVLRGLELGAVDDWLRQLRTASEAMIAPTTFFVPIHRVLRIDLDESGPAIEGIGDRIRRATGRDVRADLLESGEPEN